MNRQQKIILPEEEQKKKGLNTSSYEIKLPESTLERIDEELDLMKGLPCCGILPCKGRRISCYSCEMCLDCITGTGCSHSESKHEPRRMDRNGKKMGAKK